MRNYIQINNVSKDEWSWFLQDNGHAALVRSIDNVSNREPNLVPGLFYTCSMCRKMLLSRSGTFALSSVVDWYYWMECRKSYRCLVSSSMARFPSTLWEQDLKFTPNEMKLITPDEDNCIFYTIWFFFLLISLSLSKCAKPLSESSVYVSIQRYGVHGWYIMMYCSREQIAWPDVGIFTSSIFYQTNS